MESNETEHDVNSPYGDYGEGQYNDSQPDRACLSQQPASNAPHSLRYRSQYLEAGTPQEVSLTEDRSAAAALVQLQGSERGDPQSGGRGASTEGPRMQQSAPDMSNFYNHTGLYQSRSDTGVRTYTGSQEHSTPNPTQNSTNSQSNNVQDTVKNLSNVVSAIQQQQAHITNTLSSRTSMMQQCANNGVMQSNSTSQFPINSMYNGQINSNIGNAQSSNYLNEGPAEREHQGWQNRGVSQLSEANLRGFQQSRCFDEVNEQEWTEDRPLV